MQKSDVKRLNSECIICLVNKYLKNIPEDITEELRIIYMKKLLSIIARADDNESAPEITPKIISAQERILGIKNNYSKIKHYFNQLMLSMEADIQKEINEALDSFKKALLFALMGNYIDFGAMDSVDEKRLFKMLSDVEKDEIDKVEIENLRQEILNVNNLVYITDNCGEIVLDMLFIKQIKQLNNNLKVSLIVRGKPVLNDCTIDDAIQVGMSEVVSVVPNGTAIPGTCIDKISNEARNLIDNADVIIAKGQGNFETLRFCGKNIYYLFLCKCEMFARRFNKPRLKGMLLNDKRLPDINNMC